MRMTLISALLVVFFSACTGSGAAGVCDECQLRAASCFELTPGIQSMNGEIENRDFFQCFDVDRQPIECVCCDDDGQPACDPPTCEEGLYCLADTTGVQRCWEESRPGLIDGICTP